MIQKISSVIAGFTLGLLSVTSSMAQNAPQIIALWDGVAPGSEGSTQKEGVDGSERHPLQSQSGHGFQTRRRICLNRSD
jgi:hypothetical protein